MGEQTKIEWCDSTWNPWYCCHEVSAGCANCYARTWAKRAGRPWGQPIGALRNTFEAPLRWKQPRKIFVCSLSDFFFSLRGRVRIWQQDAARIMANASQHTYLILTKRPANIGFTLTNPSIESIWPWRSVWLGVTVENQEAVWRIEELAKIPAAVRWVSFEPLIGPVTVPDHLWDEIDWIVIGGETDQGFQKKARMMDTDWLEHLLEQADEAEVPVFFKQWGEWAPLYAVRCDGAGLLAGLTAQSVPGESTYHYRVGRKQILKNAWYYPPFMLPRDFPRQCRVCRCTERMPCNDPIDGPCSWIDDDLCSSCARKGPCED